MTSEVFTSHGVVLDPAFHVRGIPATMVESLWHYAEPYVKRALDHTSGELDANDFRQLCLDRSVQLWLVSSGSRVVGALTTEIIVYPRRKHCRVITVAGSNFAEWIELADNTLCAWATDQGCDALETYVRKGLVPKLSPIGYKHKHSIMTKELGDERE